MESEGETPMIPGEVMSHSLSQSSNVNVDSNVRLLTTPGLTPAQLGVPVTSIDDLVR
jgi:hypothetical protein